MTKHESTVKHIARPIESVYARLSDLTSLEALRLGIDNPDVRKRMLQEAGDKMSEEQLDQTASMLKDMHLTPDSLTTEAPMFGSVTLRIVERQEPKLVKCETEGAPIQATLWVQLLPEGEGGCAMKVTLGAELSFLLKQMLGNKLRDGVEKLADILASLPY